MRARCSSGLPLPCSWHVPVAHKDLAASLELEGYSSSLHGPLSLQRAAAGPRADSRIGEAVRLTLLHIPCPVLKGR